MTTSVYPTYRAIGRPIEFQGLQGPYILAGAMALIADLLLFVLLYCCGTPPWLCIGIAFGLGTAAVVIARALSRRFGVHGWMKHLAAKRLPDAIRFNSRQVYLNLIKK
ncbi:MAG TPA: DUF4133 domain-containing protein [Puia sp.]|nr:DUF4133 domain-containing protein [Puia sp.]